jgi:hypothetical protein
MVANAFGHFFRSLYYGRLLPGFWSSPFLLTAAIFAIIRGFAGEWNKNPTLQPQKT